MKSITYTITDELGIHARPAGLLVKLAGGFQSKITISKEGKEADAKRIMALKRYKRDCDYSGDRRTG